MPIKQGLQQKTQSSLQSHKKCTGLSNCTCIMCYKQIEIIQKLTLREGLEWFGKRKSLSQKNNSLKEVQLELLKLTKQKYDRKNRKNESQTFDHAKQHLDCRSSYLANYKKKQLQNTTICHPSDQIRFSRDNGNNFKTIYHDSFRSKDVRIQKQKPIKKLQMQMDLPFIGKSTYKNQFPGVSLTERTSLQKPKDKIRSLNVDINKFQFQCDVDHNAQLHKKGSQIFRPPSPIKNKGHMMKSNSYAFAYNTLYKNTFQKQKGSDFIISEPNPQFLRRSKFGSLSKTRWMTKSKLGEIKRNESLQSYL